MAEMAAQGNGEIKKQQRHRSQRVTGLYAPLEALEGHARDGKGAFVCVCFFSQRLFSVKSLRALQLLDSELALCRGAWGCHSMLKRTKTVVTKVQLN
jgi:hypothetical protein